MNVSSVCALIALGLAGGARAQLPSAQALGMPPASAFIAPAVQSIVTLTGSEGAITGTFKIRAEDGGHHDPATLARLSFTRPLGTQALGPLGNVPLHATFGLARYTETSTLPGGGTSIAERERVESHLLSAGLHARKALGGGHHAQFGAGLHWGSTRQRTVYVPSELVPIWRELLDGQYANTRVQTLSLSANATWGWHRPPEAGHVGRFADLGWSPLWTRSTSVQHTSQKFSAFSSVWRMRVGLEWPSPYAPWGRALTVVPSYARYQASDHGLLLGRAFMNEFAIDLLPSAPVPEAPRLLDRLGLRAAYMSNGTARGWSIQLKGVF